MEKNPDFDAGAYNCDRCRKDTLWYCTFFQKKYIRFCKECSYGPYKDCTEEIREKEQSKFMETNKGEKETPEECKKLYDFLNKRAKELGVTDDPLPFEEFKEDSEVYLLVQIMAEYSNLKVKMERERVIDQAVEIIKETQINYDEYSREDFVLKRITQEISQLKDK